MGTALASFIFYLKVPLLWFKYLNKGTVLEAKILGVFISHLGLHKGKISLKSVISIEHVVCSLGRPYRAIALREVTIPILFATGQYQSRISYPKLNSVYS